MALFAEQNPITIEPKPCEFDNDGSNTDARFKAYELLSHMTSIDLLPEGGLEFS